MSINFLKHHQRKRTHHYFIPCSANNHKPHLIRHPALHVYAGILITAKILLLALLFSLYPSQAFFATVTVNEIIKQTNEIRQEAGLPELKASNVLNYSALLKVRDMAAKNYFAHDSPAGDKPWGWFKQAGYNYTYAGENLAMNFSEAEEAMSAWMKSPTHKANIINSNYDEIGVAVMVGKINGKDTTIVVQHFGKSYVNLADQFSPNIGAEAPGIAGVTMVGGGKATEVTFRDEVKPGVVSQVVYYSSRFFILFGVFVLINLILTIFIRIRIQHKPVIAHAMMVIAVAGAMWLVHIHFMEGIAGGAVRII